MTELAGIFAGEIEKNIRLSGISSSPGLRLLYDRKLQEELSIVEISGCPSEIFILFNDNLLLLCQTV